MSRFSFTIARTLGVHEDRVPRGWKWGEKRLLNLTAINGNIEFRGASRSYGARIRESSSSFSFISTEMDRKKERRVGGTSLHVGTFPALADIRVAERKSERT